MTNGNPNGGHASATQGKAGTKNTKSMTHGGTGGKSTQGSNNGKSYK